MTASDTHFAPVGAFLRELQDRICNALEQADGGARFQQDLWQRPEDGGGRSRVLKEGAVFEQAGVGFSEVSGPRLPASASAHRPELAGAAWRAAGVSLVLHPRNPYLQTTHMNVRFLQAHRDGQELAWWFGGGFDLTPFYPFDEDIRHWHTVARDLCRPFGGKVYAQHKAACDQYFFLRHRNETRGIGGLFYDDLNGWGFERWQQLTGTVWKWTTSLFNDDTRKTPDDPNKYLLEFLPQGQVSIKADCNRVSGTYTTDGNKLTITPGAGTLAAPARLHGR